MMLHVPAIRRRSFPAWPSGQLVEHGVGNPRPPPPLIDEHARSRSGSVAKGRTSTSWPEVRRRTFLHRPDLRCSMKMHASKASRGRPGQCSRRTSSGSRSPRSNSSLSSRSRSSQPARVGVIEEIRDTRTRGRSRPSQSPYSLRPNATEHNCRYQTLRPQPERRAWGRSGVAGFKLLRCARTDERGARRSLPHFRSKICSNAWTAAFRTDESSSNRRSNNSSVIRSDAGVIVPRASGHGAGAGPHPRSGEELPSADRPPWRRSDPGP